ncbi:MAG TPA: hypothetical protein VME67_08075 [Mycobacterium sp.]|nr:hypothetical protein [Mycobacterium sp.]HTX94802.1 hypothetical protein [Mycobacterium sp.]
MAEEAEQVARVVDEFVDVGVDAEQRHRALVDADEVQRRQRRKAAVNRVGD